MLWFIYNLLFCAGYLLMLPRFIWRMCRRGGYARNFAQRLAVYSKKTLNLVRERERIWIHAVSVGEVYVALNFISEFRRLAAEKAFILTTTTSTGYKVAENKIDKRDVLLYFPVDLPGVPKKALKRLRPQALVLTEGEVWPNLIRKAKDYGIPVALINGRISGSSYRGYHALRLFFRRIFASFDLALMQTEADSRRILELGAGKAAVRTAGTAKYDVAAGGAAGADKALGVLRQAGLNPEASVIVGGSTWPGEEAALIEVYRALKGSFPDVGLVLVPRHAERSESVLREAEKLGLICVRRSFLRPGELSQTSRGATPDILLVDTTGELQDFYACASVVFVGKSLTASGGQNIMEPAVLGKPIVTGPHLENFPVVSSDFLSAKAIVQARDTGELENAIRSLLGDAVKRTEYGRRAREIVESKRGVSRICAEAVNRLITARSPSARG
ncbi:MAG: 3-deoxy-D-manno-octulosonic acid transferase [Kiritimatiellia bacterium]